MNAAHNTATKLTDVIDIFPASIVVYHGVTYAVNAREVVNNRFGSPRLVFTLGDAAGNVKTVKFLPEGVIDAFHTVAGTEVTDETLNAIYGA